ncbi:LysR family transcriptional regulator [Amaricoccus solimangrovi]|uniref:LysR family transcriptional regulator n=1 Tax=Amaricoccus solimangrovi TaxID=2589815 RepID=A0A501WZK1_9RHOB|nr:LysR family transcriptional regulator [Amaricoccus solimangrovi]TPE52531.1 LysR family transcriptional regulator [Amaricoccus solimangrovi]
MDRLECDRMFVAVLDLGSFSAAAARLGTSASQASKLVSRLETLLGAQLLKRTTRALAPTEQGLAYHARVKALIEEYDALSASVHEAAGTPAGRIRLSVPVSFGARELVPVLLDFARAWPGIELDARFSDRHVSLVDEGFDLAVRVGAPVDSALIARRLCAMRIVTAAAPDFIARHGPIGAPGDLRDLPCVIDTQPREPNSWRYRDPGGGEIVVPVAGRVRFSDASACVAAAEAGLGALRGPSFLVGESLRAGRLRILLDAYEPEPLAVMALYPPARHLASKVRVLVDHLALAFRGEPAWDAGW